MKCILFCIFTALKFLNFSFANFVIHFLFFLRCVVKYLYDLYSHFSFNMLGFLVEVLEKGPPTIQSPVLVNNLLSIELNLKE